MPRPVAMGDAPTNLLLSEPDDGGPVPVHLGRLAGLGGGGNGKRQGGGRVSTEGYYAQYHGHPTGDLATIVDMLRGQDKSLVFLAGDSSLDNKYWLSQRHEALNGYEQILSPPTMKADVTYWLNRAAARTATSDRPVAVVNTAIEATSLNDRACGKLLEQDQLIQDTLGPEDTLIVSVGGNDVALQPLLCTVGAMFAMVYFPLPACFMRNCAFARPPNFSGCLDCGCLGCGVPNCLSSLLCGWPLGFPYMVDLMKNRVQAYVERLTAKTKPKRVIICMIYHLDEKSEGSWADCALSLLCYDACPGRLQSGIEAAFRHATERIEIPGTETVAFPLFKVLDGKTSADYVQRVEPSVTGGEKMGEALMTAVLAPSAPRQHTMPAMKPAAMQR